MLKPSACTLSLHQAVCDGGEKKQMRMIEEDEEWEEGEDEEWEEEEW